MTFAEVAVPNELGGLQRVCASLKGKGFQAFILKSSQFDAL